MKLNFWQWLGVVLLIVGVVAWIVEKRGEKDAETPPAPPTTTPAATAP